MELTLEEYCDADLSLIRDYYGTTFSHYVPDLAERIFVVRDAHLLVVAGRGGVLPSVRFSPVAPLQVVAGIGGTAVAARLPRSGGQAGGLSGAAFREALLSQGRFCRCAPQPIERVALLPLREAAAGLSGGAAGTGYHPAPPELSGLSGFGQQIDLVL